VVAEIEAVVTASLAVDAGRGLLSSPPSSWHKKTSIAESGLNNLSPSSMSVLWSSTRYFRMPHVWTHPPSHAVVRRRHIPHLAGSTLQTCAPNCRHTASVCFRSISDVDSLYELDAADR